MKLYHATPVSNFERIMREGLLCDADPDGDGVIHVSEGVAFADFICDLRGAAEVVVFRVNYDRLTLHPGYDGIGTFHVKRPIEPECLLPVWIHRADGSIVPLNEEPADLWFDRKEM